MNHLIECLESRIAPASLIDAKTVLFTDIDGDLAKITMTTASGVGAFTGAFGAAVANLVLKFNTGQVQAGVESNPSPQQLQLIDITALNPAFADGMNITVEVVPGGGPSGNGRVDVGYIKAGSYDAVQARFLPHADLGHIRIQGDLFSVDAGDAYIDPAIKSLNVLSLGVDRIVNGQNADIRIENADTLESHIFGPINKLIVQGNIERVTVNVIGVGYGDIGKLQVDGYLAGDVLFTGTLRNAVVGELWGSIRGALSGPGQGDIGKLTVKGSISGGASDDSAQVFASEIRSLKIGGAILSGTGLSSGVVYVTGNLLKAEIGGISGRVGELADASLSGDGSGRLAVGGRIGELQILGNISGGEGGGSGQVIAKKIGSIAVEGAIFGGAGSYAGSVVAGAIGSVYVGGSVVGGSYVADVGDADHTGYIGTDAAVIQTELGVFFSGAERIGKLQIDGSLVGGVGTMSGAIEAGQDLRKGYIKGDIVGGSNYIGDDLFNVEGSGYVVAKNIRSLHVGGSLAAGVDGDGDGNPFLSARLVSSGAIRAEETIGELRIDGSVVGDTSFATNPAVISAGGRPLTNGKDMAIKSLSIGGNVILAHILAGYTPSDFGKEGDVSSSSASIGKIIIQGSLINSNIAAGVDPGFDGEFGTEDDGLINDNIANGYGTIGSVRVEGQAYVVPSLGTSTYGIVAGRIAEVIAGSYDVPLNEGPSNDAHRFLDAQGYEVWVREVPLTT